MITNKQLINTVDVSTRDKRRKAVALVIDLLERIRFAEETNIERFPVNFQDGEAFGNAEQSLDIVTDAIVFLFDAYYY